MARENLNETKWISARVSARPPYDSTAIMNPFGLKRPNTKHTKRGLLKNLCFSPIRVAVRLERTETGKNGKNTCGTRWNQGIGGEVFGASVQAPHRFAKHLIKKNVFPVGFNGKVPVQRCQAPNTVPVYRVHSFLLKHVESKFHCLCLWHSVRVAVTCR